MLQLKSWNAGKKPSYPDHLNLKDDTGRYSNLAGLYKRKNDSFRYIGKQGDCEIAFDGNIVLLDFSSESFIWPLTDTLHITGTAQITDL